MNTTTPAIQTLARRLIAYEAARDPSDGPVGAARRACEKLRVPLAKLDPVLERNPLRRFRDEQGQELLDLPRAPLPDPETPAPVRFLPTWDAVLLVHARRTGILPEEYRPCVFSTKTPHSVGTFLVDGAVAGTWRYDRGKVTTSEFKRLDPGTRREVREEAERLADLHA